MLSINNLVSTQLLLDWQLDRPWEQSLLGVQLLFELASYTIASKLVLTVAMHG